MRRRHRSASPFEEEIGFSRAVREGRRVSVSGTAPIGPDGQTVTGDAYAQAKRCFEIIEKSLRALGSEPGDVVRTRMYLVDAADWQAVGKAHGELFRGTDPAATMVVVAGLLDPAWKVEIEAEAVISKD